MGPNQLRGGPGFNPQLGTQPDAPASVGNAPSTGLAEGAASVADDFGRLASKLSGWADEAARVEGARAGAGAGLDPSFVPTRNITIRDQAYDQAGMSTAQSMMRVNLQDQVTQLGLQHQADPKGLADALAIKRAQMLKDLPFDEMRPAFEESFAALSQHYMAHARTTYMAQAAVNQRVALEDELATRKRGLEQAAMLTGLDPKSDEALAADLSSMRAAMQVRGPGGLPLVPPEAQRKMLEDAKNDLVRARVIGTFDKLPALEAKEHFVASIEREWATGNGAIGQLSGDQSLHLFSTLRGQLRVAKMEYSIGQSQLHDAVKDLSAEAEKGRTLPPDQYAALKAQVQSTGSPKLQEAFDHASSVMSFVREANKSTPRELDAYIQKQSNDLQVDGGSRVDGHMLDLAVRLKHNMDDALAKDPLGWAEKSGQIKLPPLDLSASNATASLQQRASIAEAVADKYQIPPRYFRPEEIKALSTAAGQGGAALINVASSITQGLRERAPAALAEIGTHAPEVAVLGSMVHDGVAPVTIDDAAAGITLRRSPDFKSRIPDRRKQEADTSAVAGNAFQLMPKSQDAIMDAAAAIYEIRARRAGKPDYDSNLYQSALKEASGAVEIGGIQYGGIGTDGSGALWGGQSIVVPAGVRADSFRDVVRSITPDDLTAANIKPTDAKGRPVQLETLHNATYVSAGDGKYVVALSDPNQPGFQTVGDGRKSNTQGHPAPLVLDLGALLPRLRQRNPQYFLGGTR